MTVKRRIFISAVLAVVAVVITAVFGMRQRGWEDASLSEVANNTEFDSKARFKKLARTSEFKIGSTSWRHVAIAKIPFFENPTPLEKRANGYLNTEASHCLDAVIKDSKPSWKDTVDSFLYTPIKSAQTTELTWHIVFRSPEFLSLRRDGETSIRSTLGVNLLWREGQFNMVDLSEFFLAGQDWKVVVNGLIQTEFSRQGFPWGSNGTIVPTVGESNGFTVSDSGFEFYFVYTYALSSGTVVIRNPVVKVPFPEVLDLLDTNGPAGVVMRAKP